MLGRSMLMCRTTRSNPHVRSLNGDEDEVVRASRKGRSMKIPIDSLRELERERGIAFDTVLEAIEKALASAYLRMINADETRGARSEIDPETGEVTVYAQDIEVDEETEEVTVLKEWEDTPADFGRIAAQTAKQVILQRLREAERDITFGEYSGREGDIVTGIVQQHDHRYTILDLG